MKTFSALAFVVLITGCVSHPLLNFTPWSDDQSTWIKYDYNGIQASIPPELPAVHSNPELTAFCLSGYRSDGYLPGPYIPSEAIFIRYVGEGASDMDTIISNTRERNKGSLHQISWSGTCYLFWDTEGYSNVDNSSEFNADSTVVSINYGYLFKMMNGAIYEVYIHKSCHEKYKDININRVVSPAEEKLVQDVFNSVKSD